MKKKLVARKRKRASNDETVCTPNPTERFVIYSFVSLGPVETPDGEMLCCHINKRLPDLAAPSTDLILFVGYNSSGVEIYLYDDKFWVKALNSDGLPYYNKKRYLLYEVELANPEIIASLDLVFK